MTHTQTTARTAARTLTGARTDRQTALLRHLMLQVPQYSVAGMGHDLTAAADRALRRMDKQQASDAIGKLLEAGCTKPRPAARPRPAADRRRRINVPVEAGKWCAECGENVWTTATCWETGVRHVG